MKRFWPTLLLTTGLSSYIVYSNAAAFTGLKRNSIETYGCHYATTEHGSHAIYCTWREGACELLPKHFNISGNWIGQACIGAVCKLSHIYYCFPAKSWTI